MNFKLGRFFNIAISFILGSFFFVVGAFSLVLPWSSFLQKMTTELILENTVMLSLFGLGFILIGLSIVIYTLLTTRHRYIHIRTGDLAVILDENIIQQYLEAYWQKQFPQTQILFQVTIKKHAIQVVADLPYLPLSEQKPFLERLKQDLSDLFGEVMGYPYEVHLFVSFQDEKALAAT